MAERIALSGDLTMETVARLRREFVLDGAPAYEIDMQEVKTVDSAGIGLMLAWVREASRKQYALSFVHVPANLSSLAEMYGVDGMLPVTDVVAG